MAQNSWSGSKQPVVHLLAPLGSGWHWLLLQHLRHRNFYWILPIFFMDKLDSHPLKKKNSANPYFEVLEAKFAHKPFWSVRTLELMPETLVLLIYLNTLPSILAVTSTFELPFRKEVKWRLQESLFGDWWCQKHMCFTQLWTHHHLSWPSHLQ